MDSALSIVCAHPRFAGHGPIADRLNAVDSWIQGSFAKDFEASRNREDRNRLVSYLGRRWDTPSRVCRGLPDPTPVRA